MGLLLPVLGMRSDDSDRPLSDDHACVSVTGDMVTADRSFTVNGGDPTTWGESRVASTVGSYVL